MHRLIPLTLLALVSVTAAGCLAEARSVSNDAERRIPEHDTGTASRAYLHAYNLPSHGVALEGYCPVAYFAVGKPVLGKAEHASTFDGVTYHFVNADAKREFDGDPRKYVPQYGGWCAFGMAIEDKFPVDPRNFAIVDGKLLLFLKNDDIDARELWRDGEERELVRKADAHWKKVQG